MPLPNPEEHQITDPARAVRGAQVLIAALLVSMVVFGIVVELLLRAKARDADLATVLLPILGVLFLGSAAAAVLVPRLIIDRVSRSCAGLPADEIGATLAPAFVTISVFRGALLEGPGLFGIVAVLMTGNPLGYLAPALSTLIMLGTFPTRSRFDHLVELARGQRSN